MKSKFILSMMILFMSSSFVLAATFVEDFDVISISDSSILEIQSLKYEPYPANPGEYIDLWILINKGGSGSSDVIFELIPEYPYSLDSNEDTVRSFNSVYGESILLEYKIRIDEDAVEGVNKIDFRYKLDSGSWIIKDFDIKISDAQTQFDGVIQEIEGTSISLALANTGKNIANSVIVKIPKQENFQAMGTSGQMVGNLDNGDYTIVGFDVKDIGDKNVIMFQIDYTDSIDERRSIILELPLNLNSKSSRSEIPSEFASKRGNGIPPTSSTIDWMNYVWIGIGFILLIILYKKRESIKGLFSKKKKVTGKPDWMKNSNKN